MLVASRQVVQDARLFKSELLDRLFPSAFGVRSMGPTQLGSVVPRGSSICGVGYGVKVTAGAGVEELAVRVYVRSCRCRPFRRRNRSRLR